jgi:serine/threonine protein phosphatase PrpC
VGNVRKVNQDACLSLPELGLWAVADGMGGHHAGELASARIVEFLQDVDAPPDLDRFVAGVVDRLQAVNLDLRRESERQDHAVIGSTVAVLIMFGFECACIWAGDSRVYRHRSGRLERLTTDHSLVEEYIAQGRLRPEEAESDPAANVITRAVGVEDEVEFDVRKFDLRSGDRFVICSDGLYKEVSEAEIAQIIAAGDSTAAVERLLSLALERRGRDNISIVAVDIDDPFSA